jgi:hypothetical protein
LQRFCLGAIHFIVNQKIKKTFALLEIVQPAGGEEGTGAVVLRVNCKERGAFARA